MTERREGKPILKLNELVDQLSDVDHRTLGNAVGAGLMNARHAAQCLTDPTPQSEDVVQMLTYLSTAIRELALARDTLQRNS